MGGTRPSYFWIDPEKDVAGVIPTQVLPFVDREVMRLFGDFESAMYQSLD